MDCDATKECIFTPTSGTSLFGGTCTSKVDPCAAIADSGPCGVLVSGQYYMSSRASWVCRNPV